ncbi:hypothetical protein ACFLRN_04980 [Thermoproteota archaeon]
MKIGAILFVVGISVFCLGLIFNSVYGVSEGEFLSPSVWHLLWGGASIRTIGLVLMWPESKNAKEKNLQEENC